MVSSTAPTAITASALVKIYPNGYRALDAIDLSVREGEIFGLIGPNGAGKSTTLRILATLLRPTSGTVRIYGHDVVREEREIRKIISYLPEDAGAYENLTGREYIRFMAAFFEKDPDAMVDLGADIAGLGDRIDSKIKEYSKGMKRRLLIGRTLMTSPKLAILDEATAGLDVMHAQHIRKMVKNVVHKTGTTAVVSSHNLLEVDFLCDRVGLIDKGRVLQIGTPAELKARYGVQNLEEAFVEAVRNA